MYVKPKKDLQLIRSSASRHWEKIKRHVLRKYDKIETF